MTRPTMLLPAPDSPTSPRTRPRSSVNDTSRSISHARRAETLRSRASSTAIRLAPSTVTSRASSARRRPSPRRLKASTVTKIARTGT